LFYPVLFVALGVGVYAHFEARTIRTEQVVVETDKLPSSKDTLRIAQITDLHFNAWNGAWLARRVAEEIRGQRLDLLVATGDMLDRGVRDPEEIARILREIPAPLGKYAITGNHEFYTGPDQSISFLERAGFRVLRGEAAHPLPKLVLAGVDDEASHRFEGSRGASFAEMLEDIGRDRLVILLRHRPVIEPGILGRFDLQLSGHTHGGQIFPFSLIVARVYPFLRGEYDLGQGSRLYVSRGTGTWGPPMRFLSPPEITLVTFRSHQE
jgi:predicted MPP superfamily phosphohydrolase